MKLPQLSLRDLFWLVLVAALGCAWWVDRRRAMAATEGLAAEKREVERQLRIATFDPAKW